MPTTLIDPRQFPRFAGLCTFGRYPRLEDLEHSPDWVVYGIPFDGGVTYRPGARFGPRAIRDASQYLKRFSMEHGVDVCEALSLCDAGDSPVRPYSVKETLDGAVDFAKQLPEGARLMALGGDHSTAYANIRATWERRGKPGDGLAVVHFDSHLDTVDTVWGEKWTHASPFIRAIEEGLIDPSRMVSIGIKGPLNSASDLDYARDHGIEIVTYPEWSEGDGRQRVKQAIERIGSSEVYITFDIDAVDPAFAPGTGTPSVGGMTSAEALGALRSLRGLNIVGADVVEVLPDRDPGGTTAFLASHIAFEVLALSAAFSHSRR